MRYAVQSIPQTCEMLAALMWGPKSLTELEEFTGQQPDTIKRWLGALIESGVVYEKTAPVPEVIKRGRTPRIVYGMCVKPFQPPKEDLADVVIRSASDIATSRGLS